MNDISVRADARDIHDQWPHGQGNWRSRTQAGIPLTYIRSDRIMASQSGQFPSGLLKKRRARRVVRGNATVPSKPPAYDRQGSSSTISSTSHPRRPRCKPVKACFAIQNGADIYAPVSAVGKARLARSEWRRLEAERIGRGGSYDPERTSQYIPFAATSWLAWRSCRRMETGPTMSYISGVARPPATAAAPAAGGAPAAACSEGGGVASTFKALASRQAALRQHHGHRI